MFSGYPYPGRVDHESRDATEESQSGYHGPWRWRPIRFISEPQRLQM